MKKIFLITFLFLFPFLGNAQTVPLPQEIEKLQERYPFVTILTVPLNQLQNIVVPILEREKDYADERRIFFDVTINPEDDGVSPLPPIKEKNEKNYWLYTVYGWSLGFALWLLTTTFGIAVLVMIVLYLIVKILVRLFRPSTRIIS